MTPVRGSVFFAGNIKIADLMDGSATFKSNGELLVTVDEVIKTKGVVTSEYSFGTAMPATGMKGADLVQVSIDQVPLTLNFVANGRTYAVEGTFDEVTIDTKIASGSTTGKFKFSGGKPAVA